MSITQWLGIVSLGILFGALGQGARTIVGLKKTYDYSDDGTSMSALIDGVRLLVSFGIGGVAGAFAAITIVKDVSSIPAEQLFAIAAAGYAGADFIEGFITRISGNQPNAPSPINTAAKNSSDDAVG
jgi:hypothetical protein